MTRIFPKRLRISLFGYEIVMQKSYFNKFHITDYLSDYSDSQYEHDFSMPRRINALIKDHGMIEWAFRDIDAAILTYGCDGMDVLIGVLDSFYSIRYKLQLAGATLAQLSEFDRKIETCYQALLKILESRASNQENLNMVKDKEAYNTIQKFNLKEYHADRTRL